MTCSAGRSETKVYLMDAGWSNNASEKTPEFMVVTDTESAFVLTSKLASRVGTH